MSEPSGETMLLRAGVANTLNVLGKWRALFAGWQLGTRAKTDPEAAAVRDHREATLILRAEVTALIDALIRVGAITEEDFLLALGAAAAEANQALAQRWPGVTASVDGLHYDLEKIKEAGWMKDWKP